MARKNRNSERTRNVNKRGQAALRAIAREVGRMNDADVYALTYSGDRLTRRIAMQSAHERAERYALSHG